MSQLDAKGETSSQKDGIDNDNNIAKTHAPKTRSDFVFLKTIGEGSFSRVYKCTEKLTERTFAIKRVSKQLIMREKKVKYVFLEKKVLPLLADCPFIVKLYFTFQDDHYLYFGLSYCPNGDLLGLIDKCKQLPLQSAAFYAAEIVNAIRFMHSKGVLHRDLKPENILLDEQYHLQVSDFGSARLLEPGEQGMTIFKMTSEETLHSDNVDKDNRGNDPSHHRRNSFVGTAQFMAPEVITCKPVHFGCDYWALGCIIFQMITGQHLFTGTHDYDILQKVTRAKYKLPEQLHADVKDIVSRLVVISPGDRLGVKDELELKQHMFFASVRWTDLHLQSPSPQTK